MVEKKFGVDFNSPGGALTLEQMEVDGEKVNGGMQKTHEDGWTIKGEVYEDYYTWVNYFEAEHPTLGIVMGDFEATVIASSEEAFQHFYERHTPEAWDYSDI